MKKKVLQEQISTAEEAAHSIIRDRGWKNNPVANLVFNRVQVLNSWAANLAENENKDVPPEAAQELNTSIEEIEELLEKSDDQHLRGVISATVTNPMNLFLLTSGVGIGTSGLQFLR